MDVSPGARETRVPSGYNMWRKRIEARLSEPAQDGRANQELIREIAELFDTPANTVELVAGVTSSKKTILVHGATLAQARSILEAELGG